MLVHDIIIGNSLDTVFRHKVFSWQMTLELASASTPRNERVPKTLYPVNHLYIIIPTHLTKNDQFIAFGHC